MDVMAAHCDSYSLPASWTIRTARSITSGEYRTDFVMVVICFGKAHLWAYRHHTKIDFSRPGKPMDNCLHRIEGRSYAALT